MNRIIVPVLLGVVSIMMAAVLWIGMNSKDNTPPQINIPEGGLTYTEGEAVSSLTAGVTAYDETDGDVTDTLFVYDIIPLEADGTAKVIYAAHDRSDNIATAWRKVMYVRTMMEAVAPDGDSPLLTLNTFGATLKKGEEFDPFLYISDLVDDKDDFDSLRRRLSISGSYDLTKSGRYNLTFTVSDTDGNVSNKAVFLLVIL
ncbi:MAG: hypothetical protein IJ600_02370 [Lachnospiraceae bacterium]|nr:hypothetical protein [Lachnospiraceae bacterium]